MAWNVGGLRAFLKSRIPDLQEAIKDAKPHVFGIMEHKLTDKVAAKNSMNFEKKGIGRGMDDWMFCCEMGVPCSFHSIICYVAVLFL